MAKIASALGLLVILLLIPTSPVFADPDTVKWSRVNIPTQGKAGGWVLASGSDIQHLTIASNGTIYAYGKGLTYTLYQSTDNGYSWSAIGKVQDTIVDIAIAPDDVVYYATSSHVYKSADGVSKFIALPTPGGAGANNIEITSLDVNILFNNIIVVGTRDTDNGEYGGIYLLEDAPPFTWTDTSLGNYDVYGLAFSPNYTADRQIIAVVSDETNTFITTDFGGGGWGATIANAKINNLVPLSASIAFPEDYDPSIIASYFVAIDSGAGKGDVYRVKNSAATGLNIGFDVTGLAVSGYTTKANLTVGAAASAEVYLSSDGGRNWQLSTKPPTGESKTYIAMASDKIYAATSGADSAFSCTTDGGITWNQLSLIDTTLSDIVDLAPSPVYSEDETMFMLTFGGEHSLWRSLSEKRWERVLSSSMADIDTIEGVRLPPQYDIDNEIVFISGTSNGNPAIWKSVDNGQTFGRRLAHFQINTWAVVDNTTLFVGSFDGSNGLVYLSNNSGLSYYEGEIAGGQSLNSIATSPDYAKDKTILVGNSDGWVFWSEDNGSSFESLPQDATSKPLSGNISVAFDPDYADNNTVYAASDSADEGIYRFIVGRSDKWENIDSPASGMIGQLLAPAEGTLYATNFKANGGMERCLNPTYPLGPTFETVTRGLDDGATLVGLWLSGNQLWSVDSTNTSLITYIDSLAQPITLTLPADEATGMGMIINDTVKNISLDWDTLPGATEYKWQLDYDNEFSSVPAGFEGNTRASSAQLPALDPTTTYHWRVRVTEPVLSHWSDKWSFTTSFGTEAYAPQLESPEAGAGGVPVKPIFQWSAVAGADGYELVVSTKSAVDNPTILKTGTFALPTTAWQANIELDYDTTYYWKVRAVSSNTSSPWSAVSAFTTEPLPTTSSVPPPESSQPPSPDTFDWTEWIVPAGGAMFLAFLLTMIMMLITMMILVIKVSKL